MVECRCGWYLGKERSGNKFACRENSQGWEKIQWVYWEGTPRSQRIPWGPARADKWDQGALWRGSFWGWAGNAGGNATLLVGATPQACKHPGWWEFPLVKRPWSLSPKLVQECQVRDGKASSCISTRPQTLPSLKTVSWLLTRLWRPGEEGKPREEAGVKGMLFTCGSIFFLTYLFGCTRS